MYSVTSPILFRLKVAILSLLYCFCFSITHAQTIVTSIQPYYSLTQQIAPDAEVFRLLAIGASPHSFEPRPSQIRMVAKADLIIINGVVDAWVYDIIDASKSKAIVLNMMDELEFDHIEDHDGHDHEVESVDKDLGNPHIWLNPALMAKGVSIIAEHIVEVNIADAFAIQSNASQLSNSINSLDRQIQIRLAPVSTTPFVPFHNAWAHFADHYHLNLLLEIEPAPGREPTAHYLAKALDQIAMTDTKAVFSEVQLAKRPAQVVANNAKVNLYQLDPIGGTKGTESYQEMLLYNVNTIIEALK